MNIFIHENFPIYSNSSIQCITHYLCTQNVVEDDESDEGTVSSGESLLVRPPPPTHLTRFRPIYTGYISMIELIAWVSVVTVVVSCSVLYSGCCWWSFKLDDLSNFKIFIINYIQHRQWNIFQSTSLICSSALTLCTHI